MKTHVILNVEIEFCAPRFCPSTISMSFPVFFVFSSSVHLFYHSYANTKHQQLMLKLKISKGIAYQPIDYTQPKYQAKADYRAATSVSRTTNSRLSATNGGCSKSEYFASSQLSWPIVAVKSPG